MNDTLAGLNGTIVGWGRTSETGQYAQKQMFVQVPIISNQECHDMFKVSGREENIPAHFICAGYTQGGRDGCQVRDNFIPNPKGRDLDLDTYGEMLKNI